jgi:hypothetical protein
MENRFPCFSIRRDVHNTRRFGLFAKETKGNKKKCYFPGHLSLNLNVIIYFHITDSTFILVCALDVKNSSG